MKTIAKYWKVLLAVILIAVAAFLYFDKYKTEEAAHETKVRQMQTMNLALQANIQENEKYADVQELLPDATAELEASRRELYKHFPKEMREEDQIMYILYLETIFKEEIFFNFAQAVELTPLRDGSSLQGMLMTINYETTYEGFKDMIDYLATDSRITSVQEATIQYDAKNDIAVGYISIIVYLVDGPNRVYTEPDIAVPETGKDNIFGDASAKGGSTGARYTQSSGNSRYQSSGTKVWISEYGKRYHRISDCSGMNDPWQVTIEEAKRSGRTACDDCY